LDMNKKGLFRPELKKTELIVIKIGSRIIASDTFDENKAKVRALVKEIVRLHNSGIKAILVSSGAIAHGMHALGLKTRPKTMPMKQACASIGQVHLYNQYTSYFSKAGLCTGQVLLTWDDLRNKNRYINLRNTLTQLLDCDAVPIINENDSVSTEEINFGDNDMLGAQIALLINAGLYVILTDVNGLYDCNPSVHHNAKHLSVVDKITAKTYALASGTGSQISVGGMVTKLRAAEIVTRSGIPTIIGNGKESDLLTALKCEKSGTLFLSSKKPLSSKRRWIAFTKNAKGTITIDEGACKAIRERGKSLLPAGILSVKGEFGVGDMILLHDTKKNVIGRGLTNYSYTDVALLAGSKTRDIVKKIGYKTFDEIVHRDNMAVV